MTDTAMQANANISEETSDSTTARFPSNAPSSDMPQGKVGKLRPLALRPSAAKGADTDAAGDSTSEGRFSRFGTSAAVIGESTGGNK